MANKKMHLALLLEPHGMHPAAWLQSTTNLNAANDINHYRYMAAAAETACFDLVFEADTPAARTDNLQAWARYPMFMNKFEPMTLLANLASATKHVGLAGTVSTTFTEPYNLARMLSSLDHMSGGRAAWNVVTSANAYVAGNFGQKELPAHSDRYAMANEFVKLLFDLWDTYEDDAFIKDRKSGLYLEPSKMHPVHHEGANYKLHGALNIARSPQGRPVIVQAGASSTGQELAAETAEIVFGNADTLEEAIAFRKGLMERMAKFGREEHSLKVLSSFAVVLGDSRAEADEKYQSLQEAIHPDVGRFLLSGELEADLSKIDYDEPIPLELLPDSAKYSKSYFDKVIAIVRQERPSLRQLVNRYDRGHPTFRGTAKDVADRMENWFEQGGGDGFMMIFHEHPNEFERFSREVVPELQRRGLFRKQYSGPTLRDHLGLARPEHGVRSKTGA
ncbi:LLM class flavin-dependent oxidoreductase [Ensifer sp. B1-9]|uniref:LLM class flavin-dependent oxidoreductase n=1 Tax=Ensifer sp. B1-9 TaxID=3141455 RepID=UPI003D1B1C1B